MVCGVAGIAAANPTDVVKVRQQGRAEDDAPLGNLLQQYAGVVRESGVLGLWAGFAPNAARSASISGLEFMGCVDSRNPVPPSDCYVRVALRPRVLAILCVACDEA